MRVTYLVNRYPSVSHSFIRREIQALERQGVDVVRVSVRPPGPIPDPADEEESRVTSCLLASPSRLFSDAVLQMLSSPVSFCRALWSALLLSRKADRGLAAHLAYVAEACSLSRIMARQDSDHVHAHFGTNPAAVAMLTHFVSGVTYSFTVHGPEEFDRPSALKLAEKIRHCSFVVAISSYGRSQLMRWVDESLWEKIRVVRCSIDSDFAHHDADSESCENQFVCVGRLCEQKGQLLLVEALARLRELGHRPKLVFAGDGPMREKVEELVKENGLQAQVRITGWLSGPEIRSLLLQSRTMVLASFAEGLPVVIMEAFAMKRPVISTFVAGIPELVENGVNGWLIPAGSAERLSEAMRSACVAKRETLDRYGRNGHDRVCEFHNSDKEASRLKKMFSDSGASVVCETGNEQEVYASDRPTKMLQELS